MFYVIFGVTFFLLMTVFCILKFSTFKNNQKFKLTTKKILKIATVVYCLFMLANLLLPDRFTLSFSPEDLQSFSANAGYTILRWFWISNFVILPIAVFFENRTFKNIALLFCVPVSIAQICCYSLFLTDFTSVLGKGLNSISLFSDAFKNFLINPTFRSLWFGTILMIQILIPIVLATNENHLFDFKNKKEYLYFFLVLPFILLSCIPIYVPQHLFGYSNLIFKAYSIFHILWFLSIICEITVLYFLFRKKDTQSKMIVLFVLAFSLLMQYNQMFSAVSISAKRFPIQLCNLGAYFVIISLATKNKKLFNFTVIINVVGVVFALASPDLEGKGLFYLYNMHFILEHTNVLVVPVLALMFGIFPRLDKTALADCLIGFYTYFVLVLFLGTVLNSIAVATQNNFWQANYLFMFLPNVAIKLLPFTKALFDINFSIGPATFYPVVQGLIYVVFVLVCIILYQIIQLIYHLKDKFVKKN